MSELLPLAPFVPSEKIATKHCACFGKTGLPEFLAFVGCRVGMLTTTVGYRAQYALDQEHWIVQDGTFSLPFRSLLLQRFSRYGFSWCYIDATVLAAEYLDYLKIMPPKRNWGRIVVEGNSARMLPDAPPVHEKGNFTRAEFISTDFLFKDNEQEG